MVSKFKIEHNEKWLLQLLASIGVDAQELRVKIPEVYQVISSKSELVSISDLELLLNVLEELTGDAHIGLKLAMDTQLNDLGLYGYLVKQSNNIKTFLQTSVEYYPIFYRPAKIELIERKNYCTFSYGDVIPTKNSCRHDNEWTLGWFVNQISEKISGAWRPLKVCFSNSKPADIKPLIDVFGENLVFDQPCNSFDIETDLLTHTYSQVNPSLLHVVKTIADELISKIIVEECFEAKVRMLILKSLGEDCFSSDIIAKELFMSMSTLKRPSYAKFFVI
jgi:hypothetical protein